MFIISSLLITAVFDRHRSISRFSGENMAVKCEFSHSLHFKFQPLITPVIINADSGIFFEAVIRFVILQ
jgi:hypothetical protein